MQLLEPLIFNEEPLVMGFIDAIQNLNGMKKYIENRPAITDIGESPKITINGFIRPTGRD